MSFRLILGVGGRFVVDAFKIPNTHGSGSIVTCLGNDGTSIGVFNFIT